MQSLWMLVAAALLGAIVFADRIAPAGRIGMAVIIGSGALAARLAQRPPRAKIDKPLSSEIK